VEVDDLVIEERVWLGLAEFTPGGGERETFSIESVRLSINGSMAKRLKVSAISSTTLPDIVFAIPETSLLSWYSSQDIQRRDLELTVSSTIESTRAAVIISAVVDELGCAGT
jgi:hypothetical protein